MTVLDAIRRGAEFLARKGVDSPRLQAELLLAHLLKLPRMQLYLAFDRMLSPEETCILREWVKRRGQREPLQQILGSVSFCGLEISVNPQVLVPRPETELLAETGWIYLKESPETQPGTALDFGTGSGCIAIAVAFHCPRVRFTAVDSSAGALELARENSVKHGLDSRIHFLLGDSFSALPADAGFDLILSNPPYVPSAEIEALQPEVRNFEPRAALDGGPEGLDFFRRIAAQAGPFLKSGGKIMLEFGDGQSESVRRIFQEQMWVVERVAEDYTQRPRILIARWTAC
jgi:release factor glutamine methyltransferase